MIKKVSNINKYRALNFSRLKAKHFILLFDWLNKPHIRTFYQKEAIDLEAVRQKYIARLSKSSRIHCYIVNFKRIPIGYIQTYLVADYSEFSQVIGTKDGATIDFYIGETAFLGKGLGWLIELKFLQEILFSVFPVQKCYVCHEKANIAALKTSSKAGFRYVKDVIEDSELNELLAIDRGEAKANTEIAAKLFKEQEHKLGYQTAMDF